MSDFSTLASDLANFTHRPGDSTVHKGAVVSALRQLRTRRTDWSQGSFDFITENGVREYPFGTYPRIPADIQSIDVAHASYDAVAGAVLQPDTLVTSTNLTGDITDVQDSAESPDDDYLDPTTAANTSFEVRWDVALTRPLVPGADLQIMRVLAYGDTTNTRTISWTLKESGSTVDSGSFTITSSTRAINHVTWDASVLSTLNPAAETISLVLSDSSGAGDVHFGAVQWFTNTRDSQRGSTGGTNELELLTKREMEDASGGRVNITVARPRYICVYNDRIWLYPTPSGAYYVNVYYFKDSTRDSTTGDRITTSSTTATNGWFIDGYEELKTRALKIYYATRPHDEKAMALVSMVAEEMSDTQDLEHEIEVFAGAIPPGEF